MTLTGVVLLPFPAFLAWLAWRLVRGLKPAERAVVLAGAALAAASALLSPSLPQNDAWTHYLHLREGLLDPSELLDPWDRPGFTLLYASASTFGIRAARLVSVVLAAIAAAATIRAARGLGLPHAWLAGLFLLVQHDVFGQAGSTMTELPFAAAFAVAVLGVVERRPWVAAAALFWCGLTRPEGPVYAALGAAWILLAERRIAPAAVAILGFPLHAGVGAALHGDPLWIVHANPYRNMLGHRFELSQLWESWFFEAMRLGQPPALRALEAVGVLVAVRFRRLAFLVVPVVACYLLLTFLRIGLNDAWRESRYLVAIAPALALLALAGLDALLAVAPRPVSAAFLYVAGWSAVWEIAWHWRPLGAAAPPDVAPLAYGVAIAGALTGLLTPRVPVRAALGLLLALPVALAPPGAWAKHRPGQVPDHFDPGGAAPLTSPALER